MKRHEVFTPAGGWWEAAAAREKIRRVVADCGYDPETVGEPAVVIRAGRRQFAVPVDLPARQVMHVKLSIPD